MRALGRLAGPMFATVAVLAIFGISFWLSFEGLAGLSVLAGLPAPRSYGIPLVIDGTTAVSTVAVATFDRGSRRRVYAWAVLALASAASLVGNATEAVLTPHVAAMGIAVAVAVVPSTGLILSIHMTVMLVEHARELFAKDRGRVLFAYLDDDPAELANEVADELAPASAASSGPVCSDVLPNSPAPEHAPAPPARPELDEPAPERPARRPRPALARVPDEPPTSPSTSAARPELDEPAAERPARRPRRPRPALARVPDEPELALALDLVAK